MKRKNPTNNKFLFQPISRKYPNLHEGIGDYMIPLRKWDTMIFPLKSRDCSLLGSNWNLPSLGLTWTFNKKGKFPWIGQYFLQCVVEIFWVTLPMILLFALFCSLQCAFCVWGRRAKNTEVEDLEMAHCNSVYISTRSQRSNSKKDPRSPDLDIVRIPPEFVPFT